MKYFLTLVVLIIVGFIVYVVPSLRAQAKNVLFISPCDSVTFYKLGSVDPRFGLTDNQVLLNIKTATDIWSIAQGKNLFTYSPNATITVNFVYDERQALDSTINNLNSQLTQNNKSLNQQIAVYEQQVAAFKQKLADFNATVEKYNQEGGAPPDVYNQLKQQQEQLNQEGGSLNRQAQQLNLSTNNYNYNVSQLNSDISQFNSVISQKPEQGLFDGTNDTISIYFSNNQSELIHTLAHEFGHALGMEHVAEQNAIMFPFTNTATIPTQADLQELANACKKQFVAVYVFRQIDLWIYVHMQPLVQSVQTHVSG